MSQTQILILAIGGIQGFLLFTLLVSDKRVNYASKLLGIYCLLLAITLVLPLTVTPEGSTLSWLIAWFLFLPASYGALSYLYCRSAMTGSPLRRGDFIHLLPLLACYLINYDILFSTEKFLNFVSTTKHTFISYKVTLAVFYGQALFYAVLIVRMIYRYQTKAKQTLSAYNPDAFKWHWSLVIFMLFIWCLKALSELTSNAPTASFIADCLMVIVIYFFAVAQWRKPSLFHIQQLEAEIAHATISAKKGTSDGLLDQETRSHVLSLVQNQVKERALYRNNELTLATLAEQVGVSVHHLSETLNQYGGKNFNLFINEYRVAEVCQRLEQQSDQKLIDLALDAGFSSKSSFNAIFKKLTGQTPSRYRQQIALS